MRRHARGAHRGHRHDRRRRHGTVPRRIAGSRSCAAGARSPATDPSGTPWPGACASCPSCPRSCRPRSSDCRRTARICASRSRISRRSWPYRKQTRWRTPPRSCPAPEQVRLVAVSLAGWDAAGLKSIAARIVERPGYVVFLVGEPAPAADRRRALGRPPARRRGPSQAAGRPPWRKGWRPSRVRPGRRCELPGLRRATVRPGTRFLKPKA